MSSLLVTSIGTIEVTWDREYIADFIFDEDAWTLFVLLKDEESPEGEVIPPLGYQDIDLVIFNESDMKLYNVSTLADIINVSDNWKDYPLCYQDVEKSQAYSSG